MQTEVSRYFNHHFFFSSGSLSKGAPQFEQNEEIRSISELHCSHFLLYFRVEGIVSTTASKDFLIKFWTSIIFFSISSVGLD